VGDPEGLSQTAAVSGKSGTYYFVGVPIGTPDGTIFLSLFLLLFPINDLKQ
jgi:hypothetical protein